MADFDEFCHGAVRNQTVPVCREFSSTEDAEVEFLLHCEQWWPYGVKHYWRWKMCLEKNEGIDLGYREEDGYWLNLVGTIRMMRVLAPIACSFVFT